MELNNLLTALNATNGKGANASGKRSIYKENLFAGLSEKEEKSLRKKLRNTLEDCVLSFERAKKDNKVYDFTAFTNFAVEIYSDFSRIYAGTRISDARIAEFSKGWKNSESFKQLAIAKPAPAKPNKK